MGVISHDDWSLDRRGQQAQARHKERVQRAIRQNMAKLVTDEGLIVSDGRKTLRIPVRSLDEPHFYYSHDQQQHVGQGKGRAGQSIGQAGPGNEGAAGQGSGDGPGGDPVFEAEVTLDDIEAALFDNLQLPNLKPKTPKQQLVKEFEWTDVRKKGIRSNLDRKRTFFEALKRSQSQHRGFQILDEDLRFKTWDEQSHPQTSAVIIAMMDVSGSMGEFEKYVARTFYFWTERFLSRHYPHVEIRYLVHHTEASEVNQQEFYTVRESGGTRCSSVYDLALKIIHSDYPEDEWNIYPIHVSDGDNLSSDNETTLEYVSQLTELSALVAYVEVQSTSRASTLETEYRKIHQRNFRQFKIERREAILDALRHFFREEGSS